ncbi:glycosyltransferase family 4 protein [Candidatus Pelagisphaera phototrophica]|uniref:glycosyltransferase family 4 protein n=1 Tax=Candidatus Pelagisphaera phototrophica TaxID=2684113 RepID=UPI0019EA4577|nr:glycosyltransferase family 4 protein [Candidatus Pelagisphaera phototrophica]QXD31756.1 glycosyltransferase [Candidatus Pelagisphaera phototrophica]
MPEQLQTNKGPEAYYKLASVWLLRGKADLAVEAYRNALDVDPFFVPACLELSALLIERSEFEEALSLCLRAIDGNPNNRLLLDRIKTIREKKASGVEKRQKSLSGIIGPRRIKNDERQAILVYSDCSGKDGAEQCSHIIMLDLEEAGYRVVCAQPFAEHSLVAERMRLGIEHYWLGEENLYAATDIKGLSLEDCQDLFSVVKPDLVFFSDGSPFSSLHAKKKAIEMGIPFVILTHCVNKQWRVERAPLMGDLRLVFENAEELVSVSNKNLIDLRANFSLPVNKGRVIYNGRPDKFFQKRDLSTRLRIRKELEISKNAVVCTTIGRMEVMKGYQYLLSAIEILKNTTIWPELQFVWIGNGTLENRFRSMAAEMGVDDSIHFLGSRNDIEDVLDASDLFVLPSQYEGMPLSVIEAMAKRLPVIASNVSGIPEALGSTGFLIPDPRANPTLASEQISSVIETWGPRIRNGEKMGQNAYERACKLFKSKKMLQSYRELVSLKLTKKLPQTYEIPTLASVQTEDFGSVGEGV